MKFRPDKIHYIRNFEIAISISLFLTIIIFLFYPEPSRDNDSVLYYGEAFITTMDIPQTEQKPAPPPPPKPILPSLFFEVDDSELLPDIEIKDNMPDTKFGDGEESNPVNTGEQVIQFSSLPYKPRKSYAYVPKLSDCEGEIKMALHIGKDGKVIEHKILKNSTDSDECLKRVVDAMYKSRWMPVVIEGDKFEFWLEESVIF